MTELKCPYCNKQIQHAKTIDGHDFYWCENYDCDSSSEMVGTEEMWATVIDTKKKLDRAIWWLNEIVENHRFTPISTAEKALAEINEITKDNDKDVK